MSFFPYQFVKIWLEICYIHRAIFLWSDMVSHKTCEIDYKNIRHQYWYQQKHQKLVGSNMDESPQWNKGIAIAYQRSYKESWVLSSWPYFGTWPWYLQTQVHFKQIRLWQWLVNLRIFYIWFPTVEEKWPDYWRKFLSQLVLSFSRWGHLFQTSSIQFKDIKSLKIRKIVNFPK